MIYRQGTLRRVLRTLQAGDGVGILIDQHIMSARRDLRRLLQPSGRDDVRRRGAGAAHRRAGRAAVRAAARRRPLSDGLRAPGRAAAADSADAVQEFTQRCTDVLEMYVRRHPELWLWMHRRWRDDGRRTDGSCSRPRGDRDVESRI